MVYNGIIIFGEMGSGKDTLADIMIDIDDRIKKYGLGDFIRTIKPVSLVDPTWYGNERTLYQTFADKLRQIDINILNHFALSKMLSESLGNEFILRENNYREDLDILFKKIRDEKNILPMIVGGRTFADYDYWRERGFLVVGIDITFENRCKRLSERDGEKVAKNSNSNHNTEKDVKKIIEIADVLVDNNESLDHLKEESKKVLDLFK